MNVLFCANYPFNPKYGGVGRVTDLLTKGLITLDKEYNIFYLTPKVIDRDMLNYNFPAKVYELPEIGNYDIKENKNFLLKIIEENNIDIVINQEGSFLKEIDFLQAVRVKCKVVSVLHTEVEWLSVLSLYAHRYKKIEGAKWIIKKIIKIFLWKIFKRKIIFKCKAQQKDHYTHLASVSDAIVLLSPSYVPQMKEYIIEGDAKITSIPNPNTFKVSEINPEEKENIVLFVGRLSQADKNPLRLLQIWRRIYKKHKDWKLVIVGDGADKELLQHYIEKHHICNVSLEGAKSNVEDYYRRASIVCLTSNYEGWGMALTEGMTFGCVPFTFGNYGAAYDIIDDGVNGYVIPAFDTNQYAKKLSEIMEDRDRRVLMTQAAQRKVQDFSIENVALKWDELFKSLLK